MKFTLVVKCEVLCGSNGRLFISTYIFMHGRMLVAIFNFLKME